MLLSEDLSAKVDFHHRRDRGSAEETSRKCRLTTTPDQNLSGGEFVRDQAALL